MAKPTRSELETLIRQHTQREVARMLGVGYWNIYKWVREYDLVGVYDEIGRKRVYRVELTDKQIIDAWRASPKVTHVAIALGIGNGRAGKELIRLENAGLLVDEPLPYTGDMSSAEVIRFCERPFLDLYRAVAKFGRGRLKGGLS